jgi:hypothetical protein
MHAMLASRLLVSRCRMGQLKENLLISIKWGAEKTAILKRSRVKTDRLRRCREFGISQCERGRRNLPWLRGGVHETLRQIRGFARTG